MALITLTFTSTEMPENSYMKDRDHLCAMNNSLL
jgi:hypothetical protein